MSGDITGGSFGHPQAASGSQPAPPSPPPPEGFEALRELMADVMRLAMTPSAGLRADTPEEAIGSIIACMRREGWTVTPPTQAATATPVPGAPHPPTITDAAVEAGSRAAYDRSATSACRWDEQPERVRNHWRRIAEAAIEAALPHIAAAPASAAQPQGVDRGAIMEAIRGVVLSAPAGEDLSDDTIAAAADAVLALLRGGGKGER